MRGYLVVSILPPCHNPQAAVKNFLDRHQHRRNATPLANYAKASG